jgi:tetratricopeptide (TPR) repeat protein
MDDILTRKRNNKNLFAGLLVILGGIGLIICGWAAVKYFKQPHQPTAQDITQAGILFAEAQDHYEAAVHETRLWVYMDENEQARIAIDKAIALDPTKGDYYYLRFDIYEHLAGVQELRVDLKYYRAISLENLRMAVALGTSNEYANRWIPLALFSLGKCDEGMEELRQINIARGASAPPSASLWNIEAHGYLCLGQFDKALEYVDRGLEIDAPPERRWLRAIILYQLGRSDEALAQLNELIQAEPYYAGERYYLRALIYYEKGMFDLARQDLYTGQGNTWETGGLRTYVMGLMALDAGDQEMAIEYLQNSLATLYWYFCPTLIPRISNLLASLGAEPLPDRPTDRIRVTPIPIPQATPTATIAGTTVELSSGGIPTPPNPLIFNIEAGTGKMVFETFYYPVILFRPANSVAIQSVQSLTLYTLFFAEPGATLYVFIWNPTTGEWVLFRPDWGANPIQNPSRFVDAEGNIYTAVRFSADSSGTVNDIWFTLTAKAEDGSDIYMERRSKGFGDLPGAF